MKISLGSDHAGFELKEAIKKHLIEKGHEVLDEGTNSAESVDYPIFAEKAALDVTSGKAEYGILCCGSAEGICIAANKVKGIRAGIGYDDIVVGKMREHNDANVISFGQKYMKEEDVLRRVDIFLSEKFSTEAKHHRRVKKIEE
jgi:ribose 5-phosphate isomerase B